MVQQRDLNIPGSAKLGGHVGGDDDDAVRSSVAFSRRKLSDQIVHRITSNSYNVSRERRELRASRTARQDLLCEYAL